MASTGGNAGDDASAEGATGAGRENGADEACANATDAARSDGDRDAAEAAKADALDDAGGDPECVRCSKDADFFLFEAGRVAKFVCWEHVSPHSAAVGGDPAETPAGRPVALKL